MPFNTIESYLKETNNRFRNPLLFEPKRLSRNYAVGIELELEGVTRTPDLNSTLWTIEGDGSLRGNGMEIKCAKALSGVKLEKAIVDLDECLANQDYTISERCSTHIHVDVSDMSGQQVYNMLLLSSMFEHVLFRLFGNTRLSNTFCMPVDTGTTNFQNIARLGGNPTIESIMGTTWSKYAGISLNRIRDLGTIEYRMFCPMVTSEAYFRVLEFLFALKTESMGMESAQEIITYKKAHSLSDLFTRLFPNEAYMEDYEALVERGVQTVNDVLVIAELSEYTKVREKKINKEIRVLSNELDTIERGI